MQSEYSLWTQDSQGHDAAGNRPAAGVRRHPRRDRWSQPSPLETVKVADMPHGSGRR
jgi:hypothetical protein